MFGSETKIERILDITEKILSLSTKKMQDDACWQDTIDKALEKIDRGVQDIAHQIHHMDSGLDSGLLPKFEEARKDINDLTAAIDDRMKLEAEIVKLKKILDRKHRRTEK
jgi:predicted  nucleic acid-binding Zn-ribbon protein